MKLSEYAKRLGITHRTAWSHFKDGLIKGAYQLPTGTIIVPDEKEVITYDKTVIYARVSSHKQKSDLERQVDRISQYCIANGWQIDNVYKEVASGLNDNRQKLNKLFDQNNIKRVVIEHKDRLTRFGFNYIERLLKYKGCEIIIINKTDSDKDDLIQDFVSVITSMVTRLYGIRRSKRKTETIIKELRDENN